MTGGVVSAVLAVATVTAVLAPLALLVVGAVTLTGGAFLGVATGVGRGDGRERDRSAGGSDAR